MVFDIEDVDIYTVKEFDCGVKYYKNGKLHRDGGEPAVIYKNGDRHWYENGVLHRTGGPSSEYYGGWDLYFERGKYIRTDKTREEDITQS